MFVSDLVDLRDPEYADRKTKEEMGPGQGNIRKGKEGTRWLKKLIVKTVVVLEVLVKKSLHIKSTVSFFPFTILAFFTPWKPLVPLLHIYYWNKLSAVQTHHYWLQPEFRKRINVAMGPSPKNLPPYHRTWAALSEKWCQRDWWGVRKRSFNPQSSWCQAETIPKF